MFKNLKTPHGNPLQHFWNMLAYFGAAAVLVLALTPGLSVAGGLIGVALSGVGLGAVTLALGIAVTIVIRRVGSLVQTGRLQQYGSFWLAAWLGLQGLMLLGVVSGVDSAAVSSLIVFGVAFGAATLFGEVPWKGRTWLPMRRKSK